METPKEVLNEYGISEVIERYVKNDSAAELINDYVFTLIDKVSVLNEQNKQLKAYIENNELDLLIEFKDYFPNGIEK